jgi:hypothetical protein
MPGSSGQYGQAYCRGGVFADRTAKGVERRRWTRVASSSCQQRGQAPARRVAARRARFGQLLAATAAAPGLDLEPRPCPSDPPLPKPAMASSLSFDALLPTLLADLPPSEPYAIHLPLLCAVLSRLNEPQAICQLYSQTVGHLPAADSAPEPPWSAVIQAEWTALDGKQAGALVLAVRIREALLKVRRSCPPRT